MNIATYTLRKSIIHQLDIRIKTLTFLFIIPSIVFFCGNYLLFIWLIFLIVSLFISKIGLRKFWINIRYYTVFSILAVLLLHFIFSTTEYFNNFLVILITILKINISIFSCLIYIMTTNPNDIPRAMMKMGLPHRYGIVLVIGLRFYPFLLKKITDISQSIKARGIFIKYNFPYINSIKEILELYFIPFFLASLQIGIQIGDTMISRGYHPYKPITIIKDFKFKKIDYFFTLLILLLLILSVFNI